jgi:O-antigen/teichoic acid export membrane protein
MFDRLFSINVKSEFSRNVFTLFSGTTISQIIPFIVSPILTRLYNPNDFGLLALFVSAFSIISIIVTLQYESAIILPKDDKDAINLVALCLIIAVCVSFITLILVVAFNNFFVRWLGNDDISFWLYFVPIPIFLTGLFNTLNYWASRKKQYKRLAIRNISQSSITAGVKVILGFAGALKSGLITGTIVGQASATGVLTGLTWKEDKDILQCISKEEIIKNARIYKNFPKYSAWQGFFDMFNASGTSFVISAFYGSGILGLFSFTLGLLQKPLQLIGNSVTQVYYQKASEIYNAGGNIWEITQKIFVRLTILAIIIFTPIAIAGPKLFSIVFGKEWFEAGLYARLLLPWLFVRFIASPITSSINIIGKQKAFFYATLALNIFSPLAIFLAYKSKFLFTSTLFYMSIFTCIYLIT